VINGDAGRVRPLPAVNSRRPLWVWRRIVGVTRAIAKRKCFLRRLCRLTFLPACATGIGAAEFYRVNRSQAG
jgi:hypothetical protein